MKTLDLLCSKVSGTLCAASLASISLFATVAHAQPSKSDFSGDGRADLVWYDGHDGLASFWLSERSQLWPMYGGPLRTFSPIMLASEFATPGARELVGSGDFDGDGMPDLLWDGPTVGRVGIEFLSRDLITKGFASVVRAPGRDFEVTGAGDLDGDGISEIIAKYDEAHRYNANYVYPNVTIVNPKAALEFVDLGGGSFMTARATADFNRDGRAELVIFDDDTQTYAIAFLETTPKTWYRPAAFKVKNQIRLPSDLPENGFNAWPWLGWHLAGVGDFNRDGSPDLVFHERSTGEVSAWFTTDGVFRRRAILGVKSPDFDIPKLIDLNHDGVTDLVWHKRKSVDDPETAPNEVWYMNGPAIEKVEALQPTRAGSYIVRK